MTVGKPAGNLNVHPASSEFAYVGTSAYATSTPNPLANAIMTTTPCAAIHAESRGAIAIATKVPMNGMNVANAAMGPAGPILRRKSRSGPRLLGDGACSGGCDIAQSVWEPDSFVNARCIFYRLRFIKRSTFKKGLEDQ